MLIANMSTVFAIISTVFAHFSTVSGILRRGNGGFWWGFIINNQCIY